jgi:nitroreductase
MELHDAIRRRSMCRSFSADPVGRALVDRLLGGAIRSPTAGNTQGTSWVVLEGDAQTATYWDATTDDAWRARNPDWFSGLARAPVVLLAYASPAAYLARYAEPDKADHVLGADPEAWPIPYWYGDAAFVVMAILLQAVEAGLGACVLGNFRGEEALSAKLAVPEGWRLFCAVAIGFSDGNEHRSISSDRAVHKDDRIHRGSW